jgi:hypothetical protein
MPPASAHKPGIAPQQGPHQSQSTAHPNSPKTTAHSAPPKRINVAVTPEVIQALQLVIDNEQVTLTEAVRRLISYGDFIYRAVKQEGSEVLIRNGDTTREVVLL